MQKIGVWAGVFMRIGSKGTVIGLFSAVTIGFVLPNTNRGNKG